MIPRTVKDHSNERYVTLIAVVRASYDFYGVVVDKDGRFRHVLLTLLSDGDEKVHTEREAHRAIQMEFDR